MFFVLKWWILSFQNVRVFLLPDFVLRHLVLRWLVFVQTTYFFAFLIPPLTYFLVHFSFRGSRFRTSRFFLHLEEQDHNTVPSFFACIVPDPFAIGRLQKLQDFTNMLITFTTWSFWLLFQFLLILECQTFVLSPLHFL